MTTAPAAAPTMAPAPTALTDAQQTFLLQPINPGRVGRTPQGQSHLQAWDVRRYLIRIFGFDGFDIETRELAVVREIEYAPGKTSVSRWRAGQKVQEPNDRTVWTVVYRAQIRLTIKVGGRPVAVFEDAAAGDSVHQPSLGDAHDMAMKTALSQGLKRCCVNLGEQFGLSLYNGGRTDPVLVWTLTRPDGHTVTGLVADPSEVVLPDPEDAAGAAPVSAPPAGQPPATQPDAAPAGGGVADQVIRGLDSALAGAAAARQATPPAQRPGQPPATATEVGPAADGGAERMAAWQERKMFALFNALGYGGEDHRSDQVAFMEWALNRVNMPTTVAHRGDLTGAQAAVVIQALEDRQRAIRQEQAHNGARQPVGA